MRIDRDLYHTMLDDYAAQNLQHIYSPRLDCTSVISCCEVHQENISTNTYQVELETSESESGFMAFNEQVSERKKGPVPKLKSFSHGQSIGGIWGREWLMFFHITCHISRSQ